MLKYHKDHDSDSLKRGGLQKDETGAYLDRSHLSHHTFHFWIVQINSNETLNNVFSALILHFALLLNH